MKLYASLGLMVVFGFLLVGFESDKPAAKKETDDQIKPGEWLLAKLDKIVFPVVDFEDTTMEEAFDFIRLRSIELDPEKDPARKGISCHIRERKVANNDEATDDSRRAIKINYKAEKIKLLDLIAEIAERARLDAYLTSRGIVILPEGEDPIDDRDDIEIWKVLRKTPKTSR